MSKMATREAYGKALAQLVEKRKDVIVLDADSVNPQKQQMPKKQHQTNIIISVLRKAI